MEKSKGGSGLFLIALVILLLSPIDLLSGSKIDDIAYILGIVAQAKNMLGGGESY